MIINIISSSRYKVNRKQLKIGVEEILKKIGYVDNYLVNIVFIGKTKMKSIAQKYKKENIALPVLAFPYLNEKIEGKKILGEIFICYPQAVMLAAERRKKVDDIIMYLVEHGLESII